MYGKIFDSMYDGTLYGHWQAIVCFQQMIVLCNADGMVDMTPQAIAARTSIPLEIIQAGLKILEEPDPYSRSQGEEGKRIIRIDAHRPWGWKLVNHHHYKFLGSMEDKRSADRERIAAKRADDKTCRVTSQTVAESRVTSLTVADVAHADADADADADAVRAIGPPERPVTRRKLSRRQSEDPPEFLKLKAIYPKRTGSHRWATALKHCHARLREGDTWEVILAGAGRYAVHIRALGKEGTEYVLQAATFCGLDRGYLDLWDISFAAAPLQLRTAEEVRAEEDARAEH